MTIEEKLEALANDCLHTALRVYAKGSYFVAMIVGAPEGLEDVGCIEEVVEPGKPQNDWDLGVYDLDEFVVAMQELAPLENWDVVQMSFWYVTYLENPYGRRYVRIIEDLCEVDHTDAKMSVFFEATSREEASEIADRNGMWFPEWESGEMELSELIDEIKASNFLVPLEYQHLLNLDNMQ